MARTRAWRKGVLEAEDFPLDDVSDYLAQDDCVVWADLCSPDGDDLRRIADELGLAPLAVEDAVETHERPKLDRYTTHLFLNVYAVGYRRGRDAAAGEGVRLPAAAGDRHRPGRELRRRVRSSGPGTPTRSWPASA